MFSHTRDIILASSPARIWGLDPWEKSIELCRADAVLGQLAVSDYLPTALPVGDARFDLIYAFSVFTHLSERAATLALTTLRRYVARGGLLVITIRPTEYWDHLDSVVRAEASSTGNSIDRDELVARHEKSGFAFVPHARGAIDGEVIYSDTSLSFEWIEQHADGGTWSDTTIVLPILFSFWFTLFQSECPCDLTNLTLVAILEQSICRERITKCGVASSTRGVFKQKFEQSNSRKENESQARKQCQDG